ncbi:NACHT domain-containing protein [Roseateles sp. L2-2]|uniref:NACHT domain-containing protein n=1 Tax=Roseateles sp. L2-2 TaxID=3422597 RepID=UPI003D36E746
MIDDDQPVTKFKALEQTDSPEAGVFLVLSAARLNDANRWPAGATADGMAFLASSDGLLVTAAHVIWKNDLMPGDTVGVFSVSPELPLCATARVLERGWRGPLLEHRGARPLLPDSLQEDMALLQIDAESIRFDAKRSCERVSRLELIGRLRFLPIGLAGYRLEDQAAFCAWSVKSNLKGFRMWSAFGTFRGHERALHDAFQIDVPGIERGFSGGPVWDNKRRLVVGFVRSGVSARLPNAIFCTSSRTIARFADIELSTDVAMHQARVAALTLVSAFTSVRHPEFDNFQEVFVEPMIRAIQFGVDSGLSAVVEGGGPALQMLERAFDIGRMVCLTGIAGSGKSTLARQFAKRCLELGFRSTDGWRVLPLLIDAVELSDRFNLSDLFQLARKRNEQLPSNAELADALRLNEVNAILIIDGLDEIQDSYKVARIIAHCRGLIEGSANISHVLLTSRPDSQILGARYRDGTIFDLLEILPFSESQVEQFAAGRIADLERRKMFLTKLQRAEWHTQAAPMQLEMAAVLFEMAGDLPLRESNLAFEYVDMRVKHAREHEMSERNDTAVPERWSFYRRNVDRVLHGLALISWTQGITKLGELASRMNTLAGTPYFADVFASPRECVDFVERDLVVRLGIVAIELRTDGGNIAWEHQTLLDVLAAQARIKVAGQDAAAIRALVNRTERESSERFTLVQLGALDRAGWKAEVASRVYEAMAAPFSDRKESQFALRALADGVELPALLRKRLVAMLVRMALSPSIDAVSCLKIFSDTAGLPRSREILKREELRADVVEAMWNRFKLRDPRRRGHQPPLIVTKAEAVLLDMLELWREWAPDGLDLASPGEGKRGRGKLRPVPVQPGPSLIFDRGGFEIGHRDGSVTQMNMPARSFLEGVVAMAQNLPANMPPTQVVSVYLTRLAVNFDGDDRPENFAE